jgi:hypothetical protein
MIDLVYALIALTTFSLSAILLGVGVRTGWKFRGKRLVTCPETLAAAAVSVDAGHAAITAVFGGPELRLSRCSRWPERAACGQECLAQIEAAPEACLVRAVLEHWYAGKSCVLCGKPLDSAQWFEHKPAIMDRGRVSTEWRDVRPEQIPELLSTHFPICWNCHIAETFRRKFPELVTDRPAPRGAAGKTEHETATHR